MEEFKIVFNHGKYNVVKVNEDKSACPIGQGHTKAEAMRNAYANDKWCRQALKNSVMEDIIIWYDYEE